MNVTGIQQVIHMLMISKHMRLLLIFISFILLTNQTISVHAEPIDVNLLTKIQKDSFRYFLDYTPQSTGLTYDSSIPSSPCSIAGVGFYVASLIVAVENEWLSRSNVYRKILRVINTLENKAEKEHGFFYHFIDAETGKRVWGSEVSSIDTAILMAGLLFAAEYFQGTDLNKRVYRLYENVDWKWMQNNTPLISHGYKPNTGFLPYYWDTYSEHLILQALAIGSKKHHIDPSCWDEWARYEETIDGNTIVYCTSGSLFTYQFSHAFIDFKKLYDRDINYFDNSIFATEENNNFCKKHADTYITYKKGYWGLTASLGPRGYKAYGAEPGNPIHDGTIAPYGAISSLPFTPRLSYSALKHMYEEEGHRIYGQYGFRDAFNLDVHWYAKEYLAIDQGITILMIENFKTNLVWKYFMKSAPIQRWIELCGLRKEH